MEVEFERDQYEYFSKMGLVVILEVLLFNIIDCFFEIYECNKGIQHRERLIPIILISFAIQLLISVHYLLARRCFKIARYFNSI